MKGLLVEMKGVAPGSLAHMVQARYGGDDPPLRLRRLSVSNPSLAHAPERLVVQTFVGQGVLSWGGDGGCLEDDEDGR